LSIHHNAAKFTTTLHGNFRETLRSELDYQNMTAKELATKTGIPKGSIECYPGARANIPSVEAAVSIARALGVSVEYLVTGKDTASPHDIRAISHSLAKLGEDDRKLVAAMVNALLKQRQIQS
jgi:transcriptional regulator with XRE-family HTH domain